MKYLKVEVTANRAEGDDRYLYPSPWDAVEVMRNKMGPIIYDGAINRGQDREFILLFVEDDLADRYTTHDPSRYTILPSVVEANAMLEANPLIQARPAERVTDPNKLAAIRTKLAAKADGVPGMDLSADDLAALDAGDPIAGINARDKTAPGIFTDP